MHKHSEMRANAPITRKRPTPFGTDRVRTHVSSSMTRYLSSPGWRPGVDLLPIAPRRTGTGTRLSACRTPRPRVLSGRASAAPVDNSATCLSWWSSGSSFAVDDDLRLLDAFLDQAYAAQERLASADLKRAGV